TEPGLERSTDRSKGTAPDSEGAGSHSKGTIPDFAGTGSQSKDTFSASEVPGSLPGKASSDSELPQNLPEDVGLADATVTESPFAGIAPDAVAARDLRGRADGEQPLVNAGKEAADALFGQRHSEEIRAGMRRKWEAGNSTASHAPYGFIRDETARGGWAVDPEAAKIVKLIFEKAGMGWQTRMIAEYLNEQQILPPGIYLEQKNLYSSNRRKVADSECLWDTEKVRAVLHRYEYTGAYVHNFREKVSSGNEKTNVVPKSQRIVIEDAHDAIVSQEEYEKAQAAIRTHSKSRYRLNVSHPLRGLIRCGVCGLAMSKIDYASGPLMYCSHKKNAGNRSACPDEYIPLIRIEDSVKRSLKEHGVGIYSESEMPDGKAQLLTLEEAAERYVADIFVYSSQNIEIEWKPNAWS
ncbi:MAG: recombinase family protein, partial [Lachnospiraceae bacterium]|nr:recombinase family protein [Lachnospiraceae bacterium]